MGIRAIFGTRRFHAALVSRNQSQGILRIKIEQSPQLIGIRTTRGTREFNEDRFQRCTIRLGKEEAIYVGVFDG